MKTELFKKVFIESESDLPKEKGIYLFSRRNERFYLYKPFDPESKNSDPQGWVNLFDWYLLPVESTLSDEEINTYFSNHSNCLAKSPIKVPAMSRSAVIEMFQWARDRMLPNNDMVELVKAYEGLDILNAKLTDVLFICLKDIAVHQATFGLKGEATPVVTKEEELNKIVSDIVELRQKITELRNKLKL